MIFSSLTFLFAYLPLTLAVYFLAPLRWRNLVLLLVSLFFYGWGEPVYIFIMVLSILIDYTHGLLVEKYRANDRKARWFVGQSVVFNLLLLGFFKYWDFLADNLLLLTGISLPEKLVLLGVTVPLRNIPLPIGISFFTFQTMSYTIDVYRRDAPVQRNIISFGAFVTMFPQLIAGPIVKYKTVAEALNHRLHTTENFALGARRFCVGLAKKVLLANSIGALWEECLAAQSAGTLTVFGGWMGLLAYGFQIYFDFSGYSDMAIGLGRIFGFHFNENFDYPYLSASVTEFWRRWHMSLTSWFREYLYIPLGGNRGRHSQDAAEYPDRLVLHRLLARCQLEFRPVGPVFRGVADPGKIRAPRRAGKDARVHQAPVYPDCCVRGLGHLCHGGPERLREVPDGLLRRRPGVERRGRIPPPELRRHVPGADPGLHYAGKDRLEPSAGQGPKGPDAGADGPWTGGLHRLSGGRQLQSLPVFPVLRGGDPT